MIGALAEKRKKEKFMQNEDQLQRELNYHVSSINDLLSRIRKDHPKAIMMVSGKELLILKEPTASPLIADSNIVLKEHLSVVNM